MKLNDILSETSIKIEIPGPAEKFYGNYNCSRKGLTFLNNPREIHGHFNCSHNSLESLKGGPSMIIGNYTCSDNYLTSIEGAALTVERDFDCSRNRLTSLKGAPKEIGGDFHCRDNDLISLEGVTPLIGGFFSCSGNKLTSLKDVHKMIKRIHGGTFFATDNPIKSHVLGVLLIQGCNKLVLNNKDVNLIVNKYLPNKEGMKGVLKCQEELFAADLDEYAQL